MKVTKIMSSGKPVKALSAFGQGGEVLREEFFLTVKHNQVEVNTAKSHKPFFVVKCWATDSDLIPALQKAAAWAETNGTFMGGVYVDTSLTIKSFGL